MDDIGNKKCIITAGTLADSSLCWAFGELHVDLRGRRTDSVLRQPVSYLPFIWVQCGCLVHTIIFTSYKHVKKYLKAIYLFFFKQLSGYISFALLIMKQITALCLKNAYSVVKFKLY